MGTKKYTVANNATNEEIVNEGPLAMTSIAYGGPVGGTATAGTITIECKAPGSTNFEEPKDSDGVVTNTISIAAPEKLNIPGIIAVLDITVSGFTGTASFIDLSVTNYE